MDQEIGERMVNGDYLEYGNLEDINLFMEASRR